MQFPHANQQVIYMLSCQFFPAITCAYIGSIQIPNSKTKHQHDPEMGMNIKICLLYSQKEKYQLP